MNFTFDGLHAAENAVQRLLDFMQALTRVDNPEAATDFDVKVVLQQTQERFEASLDDDLNISGALGAVFELVRTVNRAIDQQQLSTADAQQVISQMQRFDTVLGLLEPDDEPVDSRAEALLLERQEARQRRDFTRADAIRDELSQMGYTVEDSPQGSRLKRL
jgi:cysteinyl-tRNA synthetase